MSLVLRELADGILTLTLNRPEVLNAYNLAPSAVPFREDMAAFFETPREATTAEIQDIIERFGRSAASITASAWPSSSSGSSTVAGAND